MTNKARLSMLCHAILASGAVLLAIKPALEYVHDNSWKNVVIALVSMSVALYFLVLAVVEGVRSK